MTRRQPLLVFLLSVLFLIFSSSRVLFSAEKVKESAAPAANPSEENVEPYKPFEEVTKNATISSGLFTTYLLENGKFYLEIRQNQLDTPFLMTLNLSQGIGQSDIVSGTPLDNFLFTFHRVNRQIEVLEVNPFFTANTGSPTALSVRKSFINSLLGTMKIVSLNSQRKSFLVEANEFFLSDQGNLTKALNDALKGNYSLDSAAGFFRELQSFPENTEIEANLNFSAPAPPSQISSLLSVPDWRNLMVGIHYSLSVLPQDHYVPRFSDDRIGYFVSSLKDFSSTDSDHVVTRWINRWNLSRAPIVFWIENTTPHEYREAVREGVLEWNKAFAAIGFPNVLEVKVQPDNASWNSSDVRYNVIHWLNSLHSSFAGVGPTRVNPLTGEIYNAGVLIEGEAIQDLRTLYNYELNLRMPSSGGSKMFPGKHPEHFCALPTLLRKDSLVAAMAMGLRRQNPGNFVVPESFLHDYIKDLVMHEVGHCLGLRHNFTASTYLTLSELRNPAITRKTGLAASVMDYLPINISPEVGKQGDYFSATIGHYDYWAIKYGYVSFHAKTAEEEIPQLRKIASQSSQQGLAYATDEDTLSPFKTDPNANIFVLSNDPLGFVETRFRLYHELWKEMQRKLPSQGRAFNQVRKAFQLVFSGYNTFAEVPTQYIGGIYFSRNHRVLDNHLPPLQPVKKQKELQALSLLDRYVFQAGTFSFPPEFLEKLAANRNYDHFSQVEIYTTPFHYPLLEKVSELQDKVLDKLFRPVVLNRILDRQRLAKNSQEVLTLPEFFQWMSQNFFTELERGESISDTRRLLQHSYLLHLTQLVVNPKTQTFEIPEEETHPVPVAKVPQDARNLAEYHLQLLNRKMASVLKSSFHLDVLSRAHLLSSIRLIGQTLRAKINQSIGESGEGQSSEEN